MIDLRIIKRSLVAGVVVGSVCIYYDVGLTDWRYWTIAVPLLVAGAFIDVRYIMKD